MMKWGTLSVSWLFISMQKLKTMTCKPISTFFENVCIVLKMIHFTNSHANTEMTGFNNHTNWSQILHIPFKNFSFQFLFSATFHYSTLSSIYDVWCILTQYLKRMFIVGRYQGCWFRTTLITIVTGTRWCHSLIGWRRKECQLYME